MRLFTNISIKRKQVGIILLTSAISLLLACAAFLFYDFTTFRQELVQHAGSIAGVVGNNCTAALDFNDSRSAEETLAALRDERNCLAAAVFKTDGTPFATYVRSTNVAVMIVPPARAQSQYHFTNDQLVLHRLITVQREAIGTVVLIYDLHELSDRLVRYLSIVTLVFLVSLLVAFLLSSRLQRVISGPIQSLARAARAVAFQKDYSVRVKKSSEDELGQLIDGFNEMLSQIQQRDAALEAARDQLEHRVKKRTEQLANSLSLLNATLESTADGILVVDQTGRLTNYNEKFLEMWRIPREAIAAREDGKILALAKAQMKDEASFLSKVRELYENHDVESIDILELLDGRVFERHSQPQRVHGQYVGRVWCFRDITERRHAEEALRERLAMQERLAKIAAAVPGVIHSLKRSPDGSLSMPYASPRVRDIYGVGPEEMEKDASIMRRIIHPEDFGTVAKTVEESARTMSPWRAEFRVNHPQLGEIWVEGQSMPEADGDAIVWHGFLSNITGRKKLEARMAALNKELIETSRQAGMAEVATGVLHNVGNVLNSVNISATVIAENLQKSKAANLLKVVQLLEENAADIGEFMTGSRGKQVP
ncbi:MAG: PAS domain S-box protein, partial [Akkermansiaceae bacterium]|nr:PAS domain S-box protein [Verrucomicrobiales bacterium]